MQELITKKVYSCFMTSIFVDLSRRRFTLKFIDAQQNALKK